MKPDCARGSTANPPTQTATSPSTHTTTEEPSQGCWDVCIIGPTRSVTPHQESLNSSTSRVFSKPMASPRTWWIRHSPVDPIFYVLPYYRMLVTVLVANERRHKTAKVSNCAIYGPKEGRLFIASCWLCDHTCTINRLASHSTCTAHVCRRNGVSAPTEHILKLGTGLTCLTPLHTYWLPIDLFLVLSQRHLQNLHNCNFVRQAEYSCTPHRRQLNGHLLRLNGPSLSLLQLCLHNGDKQELLTVLLDHGYTRENPYCNRFDCKKALA